MLRAMVSLASSSSRKAAGSRGRARTRSWMVSAAYFASSFIIGHHSCTSPVSMTRWKRRRTPTESSWGASRVQRERPAALAMRTTSAPFNRSARRSARGSSTTTSRGPTPISSRLVRARETTTEWSGSTWARRRAATRARWTPSATSSAASRTSTTSLLDRGYIDSPKGGGRIVPENTIRARPNCANPARGDACPRRGRMTAVGRRDMSGR